MLLKTKYMDLIYGYNVSNDAAEALWNEVASHYIKKHRYYHNLDHLEDLYVQLEFVKDKIQNWRVILFTLFYHDIIYKVAKTNNEEKSAELASKRMDEIGVHAHEIAWCKEQIIATKYHKKQIDTDTNYFIDADLSILGKEPTEYKSYCLKVRKEYAMYPDFIYKKGRKKVVQYFRSMNKIFKTDAFFSQYEKQARLNLEQELKAL